MTQTEKTRVDSAIEEVNGLIQVVFDGAQKPKFELGRSNTTQTGVQFTSEVKYYFDGIAGDDYGKASSKKQADSEHLACLQACLKAMAALDPSYTPKF